MCVLTEELAVVTMIAKTTDIRVSLWHVVWCWIVSSNLKENDTKINGLMNE